jgi:hypothetical protein
MGATQPPSPREHAPAQPSIDPHPPSQLDPVSGPDGDSGDQDIDTAGTEADEESMTATGPTARKHGSPARPRASLADAPENERAPIGSHEPASMHRREDDAKAKAR